MIYLKQLILDHKWALILAIITAIIIAGPQAYFRLAHEDGISSQAVELIPDSPWTPRVTEVMDGYPTLGSIYYKEGKGDPYLFQPLGSMTVGYMGKIFSLDINDTLLLSRLVLPFFVVLLLYGFVYLLFRDRLIALCSAALVTLADPILTYSGMLNFLHGISPASFLGLAMPVNHAMIFIPLFAFLIPFWLFYTRRTWIYGVTSAFFLGLNFYTYFYSWTYLYAFGGALVLLLLVRKEWREVVAMGSVFFGGLLVAIPYGLNLYAASHYPSYTEVAMRFGVVASHAPLFIGFAALIALSAFWLWFPREDTKRYVFGFALLLAPILTMNQQIITGKIMQEAHYHWYFHKPMAVIFMTFLVFYLLGRVGFGAYKKIVAGFILATSIFAGTFTQAASYLNDPTYGENASIARQRYAPALEWLNTHAAKEEIVLATDQMSHLTVIYTPLNVFYHRAAYATLAATRGRLLDAIFTFYRFRGVAANDARKVFYDERKFISWNIYGIYYRQILGSYEAIPDEKIEEILGEYLTSLKIPSDLWIKEKLQQYDVQYVVWDKRRDPDWQVGKYSFLKEAAAFDGLIIYRFVP
ncbi:MAG: hypothetical protein Q7T37_01980 [bacterium]|nr:hypothetical protein [bacterium]MDO8742394.1 hypothetical protein [bacterium]